MFKSAISSHREIKGKQDRLGLRGRRALLGQGGLQGTQGRMGPEVYLVYQWVLISTFHLRTYGTAQQRFSVHFPFKNHWIVSIKTKTSWAPSSDSVPGGLIPTKTSVMKTRQATLQFIALMSVAKHEYCPRRTLHCMDLRPFGCFSL